jgi:ABC-2 type transport system permease protein
MIRRFMPVFAIVRRELQSVMATPAGWAVIGGTVGAVLVTAALSAPGGYQATAVDLYIMLELLIPMVGVAIGYRGLLHDRLSGEWSIHRALGVRPSTYVIGTLTGQATVLGLLIGAGTAGATMLVWLGRTRPLSFLASNPAVADPAPMLWLIGFSVAYGVVIAAVVGLLSVYARGRRSAVLGSVVVVGALIAGLDAVTIATSTPLSVMVLISPGAAYRALVLTVGVGLSTGGPVLLALVGWTGWVLIAVSLSVRRLRAMV